MLGTMPSTTIVVACAVGLAVLVVLFFMLRSRGKKEEEQPRFEPPRELAKQPPKKETTKEEAKVTESAEAKQPLETKTPTPKVKTPAIAFPPSSTPTPPVKAGEDEDEATRIDATPPSTEEVAADEILSTRPAETARPPAPTVPPPLPKSDPKTLAQPEESTSTSGATEPLPQFPIAAEKEPTPVAVKAAPPKLPTSQPKLPTSQPKLPTSSPKLPVSEPKVAAAKPLPTSEPKVAAAAKLPVSEPKVAAAKPVPTSEPKLTAAKPEEHDFSALNEPAAKAAAAPAPTPARFIPPSNPATADLEKNDPRHAAARRLARVSVSEIKLYHEDEVKAGREAGDLWKRLQQDIALAKQTFEARVAVDVRDRFDYLLDEITRQLAEGDPKKLGPDAPTPKGAEVAAPVSVPLAKRPEPGADIVDEAPTKTAHKALPDLAEEKAGEKPTTPPPVDFKPEAAAAATVAPAAIATPIATPAATPAAAPPAPASEPKANDGKPTGIAARLAVAPNPETAELEKNDPRHAAARRLARLSVSEIKLYHEDEVKAGREAKDLWKRMITDINLATQTFEKRVDKEVRERFDYLYDEILRQLAEGDVTKLGPDAPKNRGPAAAPPAAPAAEAAPAKPISEPKVAAAKPISEPKVAAAKPVSEPKVAAAAPAPATAAVPAGVARYLPPTNPATAELEKNDPRHAAARRLARLSVSEIKLYHEDEVKAGREAKDLWKRLITDIGLATQTYEKRVDKEVRERFDYLYDEILRQLAEGDAAKLGPDAPKPKDA